MYALSCSIFDNFIFCVLSTSNAKFSKSNSYLNIFFIFLSELQVVLFPTSNAFNSSLFANFQNSKILFLCLSISSIYKLAFFTFCSKL